jgi:hypothetical protein
MNLLFAFAALAATSPGVDAALDAELARTATLRLADAPAPYFVAYDVLDGTVTNAFAEQGALVSRGVEDYRNLRVEVRVGDPTFDSSNFRAFGEPDGVVQRRLPVEDTPVALRREIWLATDRAYKHAVEQLSRKEAARRDDPSPRPPDRAAAPIVVATDPGPAVPPADPARLEALVTLASAELARFPEVEVAQAIARDWQGTRTVRTTEGTRVAMNTGYTVLRVEGTVRLADGSTATDSRSWVVATVDALPAEDALRAEVRALGEWLSGLDTAVVEEDYLGPVLFEGPAAVDLFSQLLAGEVAGTPPAEEEGSSPLQAGSAPTARPGRRLLPDGWTVVDDPTTSAPVLGRYAYDHEGVPPRRVELVKDGVLRDVLMSRVPRKDRTESTGHGRALGADRREAVPGFITVTPPRLASTSKLRRTALRLAAQTGRDYVLVIGRLVPTNLVDRIEIGISGEGPMAGLTEPYEAWRLYADGRVEPVRALRFSGVDRRVLRDVVMAGEGIGPTNTLDAAPGPGRYQVGPTGGFPVTWDVPSVLIAEMELLGGGGGEPRALPLPPRAAPAP